MFSDTPRPDETRDSQASTIRARVRELWHTIHNEETSVELGLTVVTLKIVFATALFTSVISIQLGASTVSQSPFYVMSLVGASVAFLSAVGYVFSLLESALL
jgi:hypothetical protein